MMQAVVDGGTGTARADPGRHGRRQDRHRRDRRRTGVYTAWFIFFAPADNPMVAGAVVVEHQLNGFGGAVSAPIAKQLMQAILPAASKRRSRTAHDHDRHPDRPDLRHAAT